MIKHLYLSAYRDYRDAEALAWTCRMTMIDYRTGDRWDRPMAEGSIRTKGTSPEHAAIEVLLAALAELGYDPSEADAPM